MDAPSYAGLSTCCTPRTTERKQASSKLIAKPKLTTANSPNEHVDDVICIGEYNIDDATTSMMTDVVKPSTERGGDTAACGGGRLDSIYPGFDIQLRRTLPGGGFTYTHKLFAWAGFGVYLHKHSEERGDQVEGAPFS